jgi:hypothetical protein
MGEGFGQGARRWLCLLLMSTYQQGRLERWDSLDPTEMASTNAVQWVEYLWMASPYGLLLWAGLSFLTE